MKTINPYELEMWNFAQDQRDFIIFPNGDVVEPQGSHSKFLGDYYREDSESILPLEWGPEYFCRKHGVINIHTIDMMVLPEYITRKQLTRIAQLVELNIIRPRRLLLTEIAMKHKYFMDTYNHQLYEKQKHVKMEHGYITEMPYPATDATHRIIYEIKQMSY